MRTVSSLIEMTTIVDVYNILVVLVTYSLRSAFPFFINKGKTTRVMFIKYIYLYISYHNY